MQSAAQQPPPQLLDSIARYTRLAAAIPDRRTPKVNCQLCASLGSLLGTCRSWRQMAAPQLFCNFDLCLVPHCDRHRSTLCENVQTTALFHLLVPTIAQQLARVVKVHVRIEDVISGVARKHLGLGPFGTGMFPLVIRLELCFQFGPDIDLSSILDIRSNIRDFSCSLLQLASGIRQVDVVSRHRTLKEFLDPFLWEVIHNTRFTISPLVPPCMLHRLVSEGADAKSQILELVRRNSNSLVSLDLRSATLGAVVNIVQNTDGSLVKYGRLHVLSLRVLGISDYEASATAAHLLDGSPFPMLEKLTCTGMYPFPNDLLFRGNSISLTKLDIAMDRQTLEMLLEAGYLSASRFPALEYVGLSHSSRADCLPDEHLAMLALRLSPRAAIVKCLGMSWSNFYVILPEVCEIGWRLRVLEMPTLPCSLEQAIRLIESLPNITKLVFACLAAPEQQGSTASSGLPFYSGIATDSIEFNIRAICSQPESIQGIYDDNFPLSRTLLTLGIAMYDTSDVLAASQLLVILSVLCPSISSLTYGAVGSGSFSAACSLASLPEYYRLVEHLQLRRVQTASALLLLPHI